MKKILILALVVIVAGAAFAETDPVFSGDFSLLWGYSFSDSKATEDNDLGMKIDLNATIDDFNTVSVTVGMADALVWDDDYDDDLININATSPGGPGSGDALAEGGELDQDGNYLRMDSFTLSTDLTGALGVDAPVSVMTKMGDFAFGTVNVANVAPYSTDVVGGSGADGGVGIALSIDVMDMVTLGTVVYPVNAFEGKNGETGLTLSASGIAGMIDVAAFFMASETNFGPDLYDIDNYTAGALNPTVTGDFDDDEGMNMGFSVKAMPVDGITVGAGFAYDMANINAQNAADGKTDAGVAAAQLDVAVSMIDGLTAGLSYGCEDFSQFAAKSAVALSASFDVMDNLTVFGGANYNFTVKDDEGRDWDVAKDLGYDVGISTSLAALAIQIGVSNDMDYKAPEDDYEDLAYVKFSTSF